MKLAARASAAAAANSKHREVRRKAAAESGAGDTRRGREAAGCVWGGGDPWDQPGPTEYVPPLGCLPGSAPSDAQPHAQLHGGTGTLSKVLGSSSPALCL